MQREPPLLQSLAASIHACAQSITAYCDAVHYPQASFEPHAPSTLLPSTAPQHLLDAQETLLESVVQLQHLAFDVSDFLPRQQVYYQQLSALQWLCHFNILSHIPPTTPITYTSLASLASVPEPLLRRIAPMAITTAFLCSPSPNHLAHTRLSAAFAADPALRDWSLYLASASAPTALKLTKATERWGETKKPEETAYSLAMGTELGFFEHLKADPGREKEFAGYMAAVGKSKAVSLDHLVNGFDWASLPDGAVVVDVGGSTGHASRTLAQTFPHLNFIVQDTPSTIATALAQQQPSSSPSELTNRITYTPHDFFTPQPVRNAAVYLLRAILHDWPDDKAVEILDHIAQAAAATPEDNPNGSVGSKILIIDTIMPSPGSYGAVVEAGLRVRDLTMWEVFNSGERGVGDWEGVVGRVGGGSGGGGGNGGGKEGGSGRNGRTLVLERMVSGRGSLLGVLVVGVRECES